VRRESDFHRGNFIDVLDRVLDKGIVIDGWARVSVAGIDLMTVDGWVVVASIHTYLQYAESLGLNPRVGTTSLPVEAPFSL
jgi:gas vesicle structural protein